MKGTFWREWRYLFRPMLVIDLAATITGLALWGEHGQPGDLALASLIFAFVTGLAFWFHDRIVAREPVFANRAESPWRRETLRALAAMNFTAQPLLFLLGVNLVLPWRETPYGVPGYDGLTIPIFAACLFGGLAVGAATRFAANAERGVGLLAAAAGAMAVAGILVVQPGPWTMALVGAAIAVATGAGTVAALAGPRPARGLGAMRAAGILLALLPLALGVALWARSLFLESDAWMRLGERSPIAITFGRGHVPPGLADGLDPCGRAAFAAELQRGSGRPWSASWRYEDGRFQLADPDGGIHGTIAPAGRFAGAAPPEAGRFSCPCYLGSRIGGYVIADAGRGEVIFVPAGPGPSRAAEVRGPDGEGPRPPPGVPAPWPMPLTGNSKDVVVRAGNELVVLTVDGVDDRIPIAPGEQLLRVLYNRGRWLTTVLPRPDAAHILIAEHLAGGGRSVRRGDLSVPTRLAILLVPPGLNGIAAVTPAPLTLSGWFSFWWAAPDVTGGRNVGWLVGSILFGLLCGAALARMSLRRDSDRRRALRWALAGLLLGLLALLWRAAILPRAARKTCLCGRARAVTVPTCPACGAPWPAPEPTGAEVILA